MQIPFVRTFLRSPSFVTVLAATSLLVGSAACQRPAAGAAASSDAMANSTAASSGGRQPAESEAASAGRAGISEHEDAEPVATEDHDHVAPASDAAMAEHEDAAAGADAAMAGHEHAEADGAPSAFESAALRFGEEVFGVNSGDYGIAMNPDGSEVFFTRALPNSSIEHVYVSRRGEDGWNEAKIAPFSGRYHDKEPYVSPDGGRVYFASNRPVRGTSPRDDFDIWYVERRGDDWATPIRVDAVATAENEDYPAVAADGSLAFARSDRAGNLNLLVARTGWRGLGEAEDLGWPINTALAEADPWFAPDGSYIVFTSPRASATAQGQGDLYVIYRAGDGWTEPASLGLHVNTIAHEYGPMLSPDGATFYFSRGFGGHVWEVPVAVLDNLDGGRR